jgi:putative membrane protein
LWCVGEAIDLPFIVMLLVQWVRSDARDAAQVDHTLDSVMPAAASTAQPDAGGVEADDGMGRPWWETDASVFGDRADKYQQRPAPEAH